MRFSPKLSFLKEKSTKKKYSLYQLEICSEYRKEQNPSNSTKVVSIQLQQTCQIISKKLLLILKRKKKTYVNQITSKAIMAPFKTLQVFIFSAGHGVVVKRITCHQKFTYNLSHESKCQVKHVFCLANLRCPFPLNITALHKTQIRISCQ